MSRHRAKLKTFPRVFFSNSIFSTCTIGVHRSCFGFIFKFIFLHHTSRSKTPISMGHARFFRICGFRVWNSRTSRYFTTRAFKKYFENRSDKHNNYSLTRCFSECYNNDCKHVSGDEQRFESVGVHGAHECYQRTVRDISRSTRVSFPTMILSFYFNSLYHKTRDYFRSENAYSAATLFPLSNGSRFNLISTHNNNNGQSLFGRIQSRTRRGSKQR